MMLKSLFLLFSSSENRKEALNQTREQSVIDGVLKLDDYSSNNINPLARHMQYVTHWKRWYDIKQ